MSAPAASVAGNVKPPAPTDWTTPPFSRYGAAHLACDNGIWPIESSVATPFTTPRCDVAILVATS
jgi:hypothetical protein